MVHVHLPTVQPGARKHGIARGREDRTKAFWICDGLDLVQELEIGKNIDVDVL